MIRRGDCAADPVRKAQSLLIPKKVSCPTGQETFPYRLYVNSWGRDKKRRLNVNSWGRDKKEIIASRVGVKAPARFLSIAEEDSVSEIAEVTHSEADALQDFGLVVAAFNKTL